MPTRDEHEYERRRQQIIEAALHVFSRKGFEKATNKDIADAAGIKSPGLIYHYFKDKGDLFRQVLTQGAPGLQLLEESEALMSLAPREALTRFGAAFVATVDNRMTMALVRLMMGEALRRPMVADIINKIGPTRGIGFLTQYLEHQMQMGVLRRADAGAAARCFVGSLLAFVVTREVFPQPDSRSLSGETMVATAIDIFLHGMQPEATSRT